MRLQSFTSPTASFDVGGYFQLMSAAFSEIRVGKRLSFSKQLFFASAQLVSRKRLLQFVPSFSRLWHSESTIISFGITKPLSLC
jgi:hypothetical protein